MDNPKTDRIGDILIVDDTPTNLRLLDQILNKVYKVRFAPSGEVCLSAVRSKAPDMILLDIMMPDMDGYEVAATLKADPSTADIPIIFLSALDDTESKVRGFTAGGVDYITKPFRGIEVLARVKTHITNRHLFRQAQEEIVERKRVELELRRTQKHLEATLSALPDLLLRLNRSGQINEFHTSSRDPYLLAFSEFVGKKVDDVFAPETAQIIMDALEDAEKNGQHRGSSFSFPVPQGVYWCELSIAKMEGPAETGSEYIVLVHDITERKRLEVNLSKSEQQFRAIADYTYGWENWVGTDGKTIWTNPAVHRLTGYTVDEFMALPNAPESLIDRADLPRIIQAGEDVLQGKSAEDVEFQLHCKDGSVKWAVISYHPIYDDRCNSLGYRTSIRDISQRKQAEWDLQQAKAAAEGALQQAEDANKAKTAFLGYMSHELRTPLNAIMGFAQVLERDPALTPRQAKHIQTIIRSGAHLLELINEVLDMSKIEAGQARLNPATFNLPLLVDDIETMFSTRVDVKGLKLSVEKGQNLPAYLNADEGKLRQVLVNLIGNAVKFTDSGQVTLRVRAILPATGLLNDKKELRIGFDVEDTGPGIGSEDIQRIFNPFQQTRSGMKAGGTGLGLSISKKFVEMMGGSLSVTSKVGQGSCFHFEVLAEKSAHYPEQEEKLPEQYVIALNPGSGPIRVLAVDDIEENRSLMRELLEPAGFEIVEAGNGQEALDVFERVHPHAVLMDMRMPVMDGYEASRRLRATDAGKNIPIIGVTASAFEDDEGKVLAAGVDVYIRKPFRAEQIFEALAQLLGLQYDFAAGPGVSGDQSSKARLTPEAIAEIPQGLVAQMCEAVEDGDMVLLAELTREVQKINPQTARALQLLADQYEYNTLLVWLNKGERGDD